MMGSLPNFRTTAIAFSLLAVTSPTIASADCPPGSGNEFPFLSDSEFVCLRTSFQATLDYFGTFVDARQDCFYKELVGKVKPGELDCLFPISSDQPGTTGDDETDRRLRSAEARMTRRILTHCTGVDLETLGYPGFCDDPNEAPYTAFDHNVCLLERAKGLGSFLLDTEHPPFPGHLEGNEQYCQDTVARHSANMTRAEFEWRGKCLLRQAVRAIDLPPDIDCRREVDPQDPQTDRGYTDERVVEAHNFLLRGIPNNCPAINVENLGFPHRCEFPDNNSVFPLPALTECMWDFHHHDIFRFIDLIFPCSTKCGNAILNIEEECDDADNDYMNGDFCRDDCTLVSCGDTDDDGDQDVVDALYVLRAAVGLESCTLLVCDVTGDLKVRSSDALRLLQYSVGLSVLLECPDLSVTCGNGFLEEKETCDDGDSEYAFGDFCNSACLLVGCGDTDDSGAVTIFDAQYILNASVANVACSNEICDVTGNALVNSSDALRALMHAVGLPVAFNCPVPPETPPAPPIE